MIKVVLSAAPKPTAVRDLVRPFCEEKENVLKCSDTLNIVFFFEVFKIYSSVSIVNKLNTHPPFFHFFSFGNHPNIEQNLLIF